LISGKHIESWLSEGVREGVFPGASAAVFRVGEEPVFACAGFTRPGPEAHKVLPGTVFDLASLTKVLLTTTVAARLADRGELGLDEPFSRHMEDLPWHKGWKGVSVRDVLSHRAGFEAWRKFGKGKRLRIFSEIASSEPSYRRGKKTVYSDLGFILLGERLVRQTGLGLRDLFDREVRKPLEITALFDRATGLAPPSAIAPTEDVKRRGGVIHGEVHDDNAHLLGGLAGHAGLFGTPDGCLGVARAWIRALAGEGDSLARRTAEEFCTPGVTSDGGERALGWDVPSSQGSAAGERISRRAVGHLGYTGTSLWIDLERKAAVVLLTNRVHPTAANEKIREFRPRFHDAVWEELDR
jgi:CubicO group peptidase (beta-lactamase class C family)